MVRRCSPTTTSHASSALLDVSLGFPNMDTDPRNHAWWFLILLACSTVRYWLQPLCSGTMQVGGGRGKDLTRASETGPAAARSRSSERTTKESHQSEADKVFVVPVAEVGVVTAAAEVGMAAPPLAMGTGGLWRLNPKQGEGGREERCRHGGEQVGGRRGVLGRSLEGFRRCWIWAGPRGLVLRLWRFMRSISKPKRYYATGRAYRYKH
jgi:hypothetical protein